MFNHRAQKQLLGPKTILPQYDNYCFANLHQAIINLLSSSTDKQKLPQDVFFEGKNNYSHIILILIDSLGYLSFKKFKKYFRLPQKSLVSPLTSIFPSTTAGALSTFSTGLLPQEHGLFEWRLFLPEIDDIIKTLPFCLDSNHQQDQLLDLGLDPKKIFFNQPTIYQKLNRLGVASFALNHQTYYKSAFAKTAQKGAKLIPFASLSELTVTLANTIKKITTKHPKTFTYAYLDSLDYIGHKHGPESKYFEAELAQIGFMISHLLLQVVKKSPCREKKLLLITADHGQTQVNPKETVYLNRFQKLKNNLAKKDNGEPILATGGPRDVFLHLQKNQVNTTIEYLRKKLINRADIYSTKSILEQGWFGNQKPSIKFKERLGDILILPKENQTAWLDNGEEKVNKLGHHGGISAAEMLIPLIAIPF
ncbi:MAG: alkaline phosphatase family protein [Candidatus Shapirobacteria bacterium]|nr:alkaline phosphatase family protein [Candidatus Shapirobacteria bacterium]MDD5074212.1 alkaline phosphatase family protein [Candidatus Shapirobacteria bacterium]MDD5481468.1 alkaline phosphatase family protein [Candidatus Shapirobacteria bacterium]